MTLTREDPELARPIESPTQLVEFFRKAETPRAEWRVGTEHEKVGLYYDSLEPLPYEGERGIAALLRALEREHDFAPLLDEGRLVGLERDGATITLEPGGQLELSGVPFSSIHETCREFQGHLALMKHVSERFGMVWLGLGIHPLAKLEEIPRMPRSRYTIMRDFLGGRGELALEMMHATGSVQVNLDFASEADLARKMRVALALSPVLTALYANSSISEGAPNGFLSRRAWIWRHTAPARCGLLPFAFSPEFIEGSAYRAYAKWALDVPMIFIVRGGAHRPMRGRTFREFLAEGAGGEPATLADWNLHLTSLFPEVRLKRVLEVRGCDAVPPGLVCGLPAFWKGLLYDDDSLRRAWELVGGWSFDAVDRLHAEVARRALRALTPSGPLLEICRTVLDLAAAGLRRMDVRNRFGEDERLFLEPLYELLERRASPGQHLIERWEGAWQRRVDRLIEYSRY
ncbi:MAG: glutamate--cysteine ligase [Myxococcota bacterium]